MSKALKNVNNHATAPTDKATPSQVLNNAGGYVFKVTPKSRLERFLILGTDGGTFYVGQKEFTNSSVEFVKNLIATDEKMVRETMLAVNTENRAHKVSPAIFVGAMLHVYGNDKAETRAALAQVLRTSTQLFEYAQYIKNLGGWGRSKRGVVADWYENKTADALAYQLVKYRQRNGWTHRDLLRISHALPDSANAKFALGTLGKVKKAVKEDPALVVPELIAGFQKVQKADSIEKVLKTLDKYPNLPWEAVPTEFHKSPALWKKLFANGQLKGVALVRNVLRLAKNGAFEDIEFMRSYANALKDPQNIKAGRLHPIQYLNALTVYTEGQTDHERSSFMGLNRKSVTWSRDAAISDALEEGFYAAFGNVESSGKETLIALDVSGSMATAATGLDLSCATVGAVIAMAVARSEEKYEIRGFSNVLVDLGITAKDSLNTVKQKISRVRMGSTDCSLPMEWAIETSRKVDTFVVITDNETYQGRRHPVQALKAYRKQFNAEAKLAVLGVSATDFTIADPEDSGMMDFVGFDAGAISVLADFSAGRI